MQCNLSFVVLLSISFVGLISTFMIRGKNSSQKAIQIAHPTINHTFEFELDDLKALLEADNIKDREVVIVSVAGTLRKGKSFLMNFFLRYLYAQYDKHDVSDWIGAGNKTELRGFHWRGGVAPATTGIVMWSDIFTHDYENGDKVAIILLDTQGTFDSRSTLLESSTVFALSTLLSSIQCYNVLLQIQEDDLQNLQLFVDYARLALEQSNQKPFQNLLFIVRDWPNQDEVDYGWNGQQVIDEKLAEHHSYQTNEMRQLRQQIRSSFANINAFLMPHPGLIVANGRFTGNMEEIDADFKTYLQILVPSLFAPENLVVKEINGQRVRAHELVHYVEEYTQLFGGETLPEPKSVLQATAEVNNMILLNNSLNEYLHSMRQYFKNDANKGSYLNVTTLEKIHLEAKRNAIEQFQSKRKLGGKELILSFERKLDDKIELKFLDFQAINEKTRLALVEEAKFHNEKCVNEIELSYREKMMERANGVSDEDFSDIFTQMKATALREFDALKMGDSLDDEKFSYKFKKTLENNLDTFWSPLEKLNRVQRVNNEHENSRRQNEIIKKGAITTGSAAAGVGVGAVIGGPAGAAIGFILGGLFGGLASLIT